MALSTRDKKILEEIVNAGGACLNSKRCAECPFRASCLPEFISEFPLSQPQRFKRALDVLTHNSLLDDGVEHDYTWEAR